jgi:serine/threonine-protein kinase
VTTELPWSRIKELFRQIQDIADCKRENWLDVHCGPEPDLRKELAGLLSAQRTPRGILDADANLLLGLLMEDGVADDRAGQRIGPYRLVRLIGEGGMGSVFLAERDDADFVQRVALKQVRVDFASAEGRARFLREREILARLTHPHIAQLHDGGVAGDGTPYFTLEYVEGEPITRYCDAHALTIRQRLALLLQVAAAVAYAHRNLVVHRDLKPSNIMVTANGEAKLLDFGIAKLLDAEPAAGMTQTHARLMTREYAAPEQVLGEPITTATDIYALGVLLSELLTGHLPYPAAEAGHVTFAKAIVEQPPEPPSRALRRLADPERGDDGSLAAVAALRSTTPQSLRRTLCGDLDRIVLRALEKSPEARYPNVGAFADDLRAYLDGRPVRGGTRMYRFAKFVRHHWLPLAAGASVLLVALIGSAMIAWEARERVREAERTLRETATTAAVKDFLLGLFAGADPRANAGKQVSVRDLLDKGAQHIDQDLGAEPGLQAELKSVLGGIYSRLGLYPQAIKLDEQAVAGLDAAGHRSRLAAHTLGELARAVRANGDAKRAEALLDEMIERLGTLPDAPPGDLVDALYLRTFIATDQHRFDEALRYADRAETIARAHPDRPALLGDALHAKASAQWGLHAYKDAETELQEAIRHHEAAGPTSRMPLGADRQTLALIYSETGRYADALALDEEVLAGARAAMGERHPYVAQVMEATAGELYHLGNYGEAERRLQQALAMQRELLGSDSYYLANTLDALGAVFTAMDRFDDARQALGEARDIWVRRHGPDYAHVLDARSDLASIELEQGEADVAQSELRKILAARERTHDTDVSTDTARLAEAERRNGQIDAAIEHARESLANAIEIHGKASWQAARAKCALGLALADAGQLDAAQMNLREAIGYYDALVPGGDHPLAARARVDLVSVLARDARPRPETVELAAATVQQHLRLYGEADARTRAARDALTKLRARR